MNSLELSLKTTHIGSLPFTEINKSLDIAFSFDIPAWPQLSKFKEEGMLWQFIKNFPGFNLNEEKVFTETPSFEEEMLKFYELYIEIIEAGRTHLLESFLEPDFSKTFFPFLERAKEFNALILKGQITGPFTLGIALKNEKGEALIFRDELRDLLVKFLTLKALAQAFYLKKVAERVILFLDEPGLSGFGSSAYIALSKNLVLEMLKEIISILKSHNILTGIHVCANTSWDLILETETDIVSLDSFSFFDKFSIYAEKIEEFLNKGGYIAWGIIPTDKILLEKIKEKELIKIFQNQLELLAQKIHLENNFLLSKSLLTPACGLGSLEENLVDKVLFLIKYLKEQTKISE